MHLNMKVPIILSRCMCILTQCILLHLTYYLQQYNKDERAKGKLERRSLKNVYRLTDGQTDARHETSKRAQKTSISLLSARLLARNIARRTLVRRGRTEQTF